MSRPDITLTPAERRALLSQPLKAALATVDADGFPHIVAMSFLARDDGAIYMTSYAKAQKVLNVRRNPKVAVMIETGQQYSEFHAVMVRGHCEVIEDRALVEETMRGIAAKRTEKQVEKIYAKQKKVLRARQAKAKLALAKLSRRSAAATPPIKAGVQRAWSDLSDAVRQAAARFRNTA